MPILAANLSTLFQEVPFLDRFAHAARAGFKIVEVQFPYELPAEELRRALDDADLRLALMNAPAGDLDRGERGLALQGGARFRASIEQAIAYAAALGSSRLHVLIGQNSGDAADAAALRDELRWAADRMSAAGITLMLEALNERDNPGYALPTPKAAEALRSRVDRPNVQLQIDTFHVERSGGDPLQVLAQLTPRIGHVQIAHPADRGEPDNPRTAAFLQALDNGGYAGVVGCEYTPRTTTAAGLKWARAYGIGGRDVEA